MKKYLRAIRLLLLLALGVVFCTAPSYQGTRYSLLSPMMEGYLLNDNFTTPLAAGSVNGTNAEPGPGLRTVVDSGSHTSITGGNLSLDGGSGGWNTDYLIYGAQTRVPGLMLIAQRTIAATGAFGFLGWSKATNGALSNLIGVQLNNVTISNEYNGGNEYGIGTFGASAYKIAVILRVTGQITFIKGGAFTNWTLINVANAGTDATMYPISLTGNQVYTSSFLRIPTTLYLPPPLLSDGFGSTFGLSDGLGHAEGDGT
ncbi:MAG: hypothetical protein WC749_02100 [Dehalococcoidia bacterium]